MNKKLTPLQPLSAFTTPKSKIFESEIIRTTNATQEDVYTAEKIHNDLYEMFQRNDFVGAGVYIEKCQKELNEGFFSGLIGGGASALVGPAVMKAVCKALGIQEGGSFYNLLTSSLVLGAIGYTLFK